MGCEIEGGGGVGKLGEMGDKNENPPQRADRLGGVAGVISQTFNQCKCIDF